MHPSRALFQIVRNPPPTLYRPTSWSQGFNDFIAECLEKNPENRPMMMEIVEHPFLNELFDDESAMQSEIKQLLNISNDSESMLKEKEMMVDRGYIRRLEEQPEKIYHEDLAAISEPTEEKVNKTLQARMAMGYSYSFIGDILLSLNSNDIKEEDELFHSKYKNKSRSDNIPHIFSVADIAYQDMLHHKDPQHIIFSGESYSGKSTNVDLFIKHVCYLSAGNKGATERVLDSITALRMLINAGTPLNNNSTRCAIQYYLTFGTTGKMSGAVYNVNMLEKSRVSTTDMNQHNFHIFYYFYDFMVGNGKLNDYHLKKDRNYRYLRVPADNPKDNKLPYCRDDPEGNIVKFTDFERILKELDISVKNIETIRKLLAAILNIGNIHFKQNEKKYAEIEDLEAVTKIADLLRIDEKKMVWSFINFCKIKGGIAERKQYNAEEARDARDALAATMYQRLVDWIVNKININMAFPRAVFGDINSIIIYDMFGFECFHKNGFEQLMVNTLNEQMQYHYNRKIFVNEMMEQDQDGLPGIALNFYDNRTALDNLLTKPDGLFCIIDDFTRNNVEDSYILDQVNEKKSQFIKTFSNTEINVSHFTGKIVYDIRNFKDANKDFVPPEMIESLRTSLDETIVLMFTNQLTKAGNLTMAFENVEHKSDAKRRTYALNTLSVGHISQVNNVRTLSANFRHTCLELLKVLSKGYGYGTHFVRCIRSDLEFIPRNFHTGMVNQQMRALGVLDTLHGRQNGYSCRIAFSEFLRRYQFLGFDFDETVDITKDNCRLLLLRLKIEGWAIGKTKVFLRYFNDEYLSRLYEIQVKKVIKVQSMMRSMLAKRKLKGSGGQMETLTRNRSSIHQDDAAITIQKAFRGFKIRQKYGPLLNEKTGQIDTITASFVHAYAAKWKKKSIFQVLLLYRAAKYKDFVNLTQQVHIYNQRVTSVQNRIAKGIPLSNINTSENNPGLFGTLPIPAKKLPFRLDEIPYYDTSFMCDPVSSLVRQAGMNQIITEDDESWDAPFQRRPSVIARLMSYNALRKEQGCQTNWNRSNEHDHIYQQTFCRDPNKMSRYKNSRFDNGSSFNNKMNDESSVDRDIEFISTGNNNFRSNRTVTKSPGSSSIHHNKNDASRSRFIYNVNPKSKDFNNIVDNSPSNPVEEINRFLRDSNTQDIDNAPFDFKSRLRKTNYRLEQSDGYGAGRNTIFGSSDDNHNTFTSRLRPTGRLSDEYQKQDINTVNQNYSTWSEKQSIQSETQNSSRFVEEEIAPGVTVYGYEIDI
ncbi:MYO3A family protein [Megaselia abdita]